MAISVTHTYVSPVADEGRSDEVGPDEWNAAHTLSGFGSGVETFLATPSSANLASAVTDETGSGALVFATSPTLVTPDIGVATGTSLALGTSLVQPLTVAGNASASGYLRVGSNTAPNNTTAGDLTAVRLSIGNTSLGSSAAPLYVTGTLTETSGTTSACTFLPVWTGASNSGQQRAMVVSSVVSSSQTGTNSLIYAALYQNDWRGTGSVSQYYGLAADAVVQNGLTNNFGTIGLAAANVARVLSSFSNTKTGTITTGACFYALESTVGTTTLTNQVGFYAPTFAAGTNNTYILLGTTPQTGNWGIYSATTDTSYFAGSVTIGTTSVVQPLTVSGNASASGYLRVGSNTAPNNTTAGDITGTRISLGNTAMSGSLIGDIRGTATDTAAGVAGLMQIIHTLSPGSASSTQYQSLIVRTLTSTSQTLNIVSPGYFYNLYRGSSSVTTVIGGQYEGLTLDGSSVNFGTITSVSAGNYKSLNSTAGAGVTGTISYCNGISVSPPTTTAGLTITNLIGMSINTQTAGTNNTYLLLGTSTSTTGNWGIYSTTTNQSYFAGPIGRAVPVTETGTSHTVAAGTTHLICNNSGTVTVTLPSASTFTGRELYIKNIDGTATVVSASSNVVPSTSATAGTAILPATDGAWAFLVSDGSNWIIMAQAVS